MVEKEIYIIRHGETEYNQLGIVQGRGINSSLNETGRAQALAFYERYRSTPFDMIYTSTLKRTNETVEPFVKNGFPFIASSDLDEMDWGVQEGVLHTDASKATFVKILDEWKAGNYALRVERGESPLDVQKRQLNFLESFIHTPYQKVLICMHGRAMRIFLCTLLKKELSEMDNFPHSNLCLYQLRFKAGEFELVQ